MRSVVFGGAVAALAGVIFGAGMKAPVGRDLPQPELQQVSYPVETVAHENFRPEYVVAAAYATHDWANPEPQLWHAAYAAPAPEPEEYADERLTDLEADEPALNADPAERQDAAPEHRGDPTMPYASGMTTPAQGRDSPEARPTSSWPNKRTDAKQQVFNGYDGFEHVRGDAAA